MNSTSNPRRSDERGAILVLGIMLGAFSVAALAYLANVGYASIWREGAQDAADAVAFESAVWSARGMNVLAAINIFIAITMAVLIAWRLALMALGLLTVISLVLCLIPGTQGVCASLSPRLASATTRMATRDPKVSQNVYKVIRVLNKGQTVVASAMPILAAAESSIEGLQRPRVGVAAAFGTQFLPAGALNGLKNAVEGSPVALTQSALKGGTASPGRKGGAAPGGGKTPGGTKAPAPGGATKPGKKPEQGAACPVPPQDKTPPPQDGKKPKKKRRVRPVGALLGAPFSLPMEKSDDLDTLCAHGTQMVTSGALVFKTLLRELIGAEPDPNAESPGEAPNAGLLQTAWDKIVGLLPSAALCGDLSTASADIIGDQVDQACAPELEQQRTKFDPLKKDGETWEDACKRETKTELEKKQADANARQSGAKKGALEPPTYAEVWGPLANGAIFAQTWSIARVAQDHGAFDRMLGLAGAFGGGRRTLATDPSDAITMLAQSELFFDCEGDWDGSCFPTAAWTLNWRARLRRLHSPIETATAGVERQASARFNEILNQPPVTKLLAALPGGELAEMFAPVAGGLVPDSLRAETEALRSQVAERGGAAARWVVEQGRDRASFIH